MSKRQKRGFERINSRKKSGGPAGGREEDIFRVDKKAQKAKVITISFAHLLHDTYSAFLAPMLPLLISRFGLSLSMAGLLDVVRRIPTLFNPFVGLLADRLCVKYVVIFAPAVTAISMSLLGISPSYTILLILLFTTGVSSTLFHVPAPVMVKHLSADKTGMGMSYFMFGGELARTLGPLLITAALSMWGLEGSYRVLPIALVASLILYFKLKSISSIPDKIDKKRQKGAGATIKELAPFFVFVTGFLLFRAGMKSALTLYLPTYLTGKGESLWTAGISLSMLQLAGAAGTFGAGSISDRIGHRNTLLITAIGSPLVMLAFTSANHNLITPLLILMGVLLFASGPVILALVQETNTERPAFINGIYMTINFSISSLLVLVVGILGDHVGLLVTYRIGAILAFFAVPFIFILPRR